MPTLTEDEKREMDAKNREYILKRDLDPMLEEVNKILKDVKWELK